MEKYFNIRYEFDKAVVQERIAQKVTEQGAGYICVADANILQQVHNDFDYREVVDGRCSPSATAVGYPYL